MAEIIIPALITAAVSVVVVCYTQYKARKIAFFQTYFNRKLDAYAAFWASLSKHEMFRTDETKTALTANLHLVSLFAPEDIYIQTLKLANSLDSRPKLDGAAVESLTNMMRRDLDSCRRMKFSPAEYWTDKSGQAP